ncbi:MAG: fumarylacetoacetase [Gemmatimonadota bacterium]
MPTDLSHDSGLQSWVPGANAPETDFPVQNLPYGLFRRAPGDRPSLGVAIGDHVLDLRGVAQAGHLGPLSTDLVSACQAELLNPLLALGAPSWQALRHALSNLLREGPDPRPAVNLLPALGEVELLLPMSIGDYSDFYASIHHASNVGSMFRPDNPLLPNYRYVPIGYHGRASSVVVSGTPVRRPSGQLKDANAEAPSFGPSRMLDYECEVGFVVGPGNPMGTPIPIAEAGSQLFGFCLVNDWSARDIQAWEYQPLGPFLSKSFHTTISPWIVTSLALEPFRIPAMARSAGDPSPLPYLHDGEDQLRGGLGLELQVALQSRAMRDAGLPAVRLSRADFADMYWTPAQMLAHHASNGCNLCPGDLLASGTVSGSTEDARGCLLELTWRGTKPIALPSGETRRFLEDGDEVVISGRCARDAARSLGFGLCRGRVVG